MQSPGPTQSVPCSLTYRKTRGSRSYQSLRPSTVLRALNSRAAFRFYNNNYKRIEPRWYAVTAVNRVPTNPFPSLLFPFPPLPSPLPVHKESPFAAFNRVADLKLFEKRVGFPKKTALNIHISRYLFKPRVYILQERTRARWISTLRSAYSGMKRVCVRGAAAHDFFFFFFSQNKWLACHEIVENTLAQLRMLCMTT